MRLAKCLHPVAAAWLTGLATSAVAVETPMTLAFDLPSTDVAVAGAGGIGERGPPGLGGAGIIALGGVSGSVRKAWLYWHGLDLERAASGFIGGNFDYDEAAIEFDGSNITGSRIAGMGSNNCWPNDTNPSQESAALYRADVTARVQARGNGDYTFSGLADGAGHSANGISMIVYFDDGDPGNDVRVRHFEGLKADWNTTFEVHYQGGAVEAILHVVDGQSAFVGNPTRWEARPGHPAASGLPSQLFYQPEFNGVRLWAGLSVPNMMHERPLSLSGLWDIQRLAFSSLFGPMRSYNVNIHGGGSGPGGDCYSLMVMQVLEPVTRKALTLEPAWHDFGEVQAQTSSTPQVFNLTNWMSVPIRFPLPPQVLNSPGLFPISANSCTGQTLQPGAQCSFSLRCAPPNVVGSIEDVTVLMTWQSELQQNFAGGGSAYGTLDCTFHLPSSLPRLQIDPPQFDFGSIAANQTSPPRAFVVSNSGNVPLTVQGVLGFTNGFEQVSSTCTTGLLLAPGAQCQVQVRFRGQGSPGSARATDLFVTYSHADDSFDRRGSPLYATNASVDAAAIFADGFEP